MFNLMEMINNPEAESCQSGLSVFISACWLGDCHRLQALICIVGLIPTLRFFPVWFKDAKHSILVSPSGWESFLVAMWLFSSDAIQWRWWGF